MLSDFGGQPQPVRRLHRGRSEDAYDDLPPGVDYVYDEVIDPPKSRRSKSAGPAGNALGDRVLRRHEQEYYDRQAPAAHSRPYANEYVPAGSYVASEVPRYSSAAGGAYREPRKKMLSSNVFRVSTPLYCPEQLVEAEIAEVARECEDLRKTRRFSHTQRYDSHMYGMASADADPKSLHSRKRMVRPPHQQVYRYAVPPPKRGLGMPAHRKESPAGPYFHSAGTTQQEKVASSHAEIFGDHGRRSRGMFYRQNSDNDPILQLRGRSPGYSPAYSGTTIPMPVPMDQPLGQHDHEYRRAPESPRKQPSPRRDHSRNRPKQPGTLKNTRTKLEDMYDRVEDGIDRMEQRVEQKVDTRHRREEYDDRDDRHYHDRDRHRDPSPPVYEHHDRNTPRGRLQGLPNERGGAEHRSRSQPARAEYSSRRHHSQPQHKIKYDDDITDTTSLTSSRHSSVLIPNNHNQHHRAISKGNHKSNHLTEKLEGLRQRLADERTATTATSVSSSDKVVPLVPPHTKMPEPLRTYSPQHRQQHIHQPVMSNEYGEHVVQQQSPRSTNKSLYSDDLPKTGLRTGYKYSANRDNDPILHMRQPVNEQSPRVSRKGGPTIRSRSAPASRAQNRHLAPTQTALQQHQQQQQRGRTGYQEAVHQPPQPDWDSLSATSYSNTVTSVSVSDRYHHNHNNHNLVAPSTPPRRTKSAGAAKRRASIPGV